MKRIVIIGASGHGKVAADIAKRIGYEQIEFLDDNPSVNECGGYAVIGSSAKIPELDADFIVGIGNASIREKIQRRILDAGRPLATLIHPNAIIGENVIIGRGTVVMAGTVINPGTVIGEGCIINTCASVDHDCRLADFTHVSVDAHLAGTVEVGKCTWIGIGAVVSNNLTITDNCFLGAGAVVVKNIMEPGTYVGVPAKKIK